MQYAQAVLSRPKDLPDFAGEVVFIDTETNGIEQMTSLPFLVSLGVGERNYHLRWDEPTVALLNEQLPKVKLLVGWNLKFDLHMLLNGGMHPDSVFEPSMFCGMLADSLCFEHHRSYSIEASAGRWSADLVSLGVIASKFDIDQDIKRYFQLKHSQKNPKQYLHKLPIDAVLPYAEQDIRLTRGLFKVLSRDLIR